MSSELAHAAAAYRAAGLCVLPARAADKRPSVSGWKEFQSRLPTAVEVEAWFANSHDACCLICGAVSGNLELLDFDGAGELYPAWQDAVRAEAPELLDRVVIERSPSGGCHVVYRCAEPVCGNLKLASRREDLPGPESVARYGKACKPRKDKDGRWHIVLTLIETRGEGGLFLCAPSTGYRIVQGDLAAIPVLSAAERDVLLRAAWTLNEIPPEAHDPQPASAVGLRPGDEFNQRAEVVPLLLHHGWSLARDGDNQYWRRPGKTEGWSATLKGGVFYVFSSSADPFEPNRAYSPFAVYALLEHAGNYAAAAAELRLRGFGDQTSAAEAVAAEPQRDPESAIDDPGPIPLELLRVPGFISQVMDHCLATAPYPNPTMAFCGALSLQAFLAGRKVREPGGLRTNLYLLGLAHSASGKDWPRKLNTRILHAVGLSDRLGDRFASGEGLQDALFVNPAMLFQTDEIDGLLQSINKAQDARHEGIMGTLLTLYTSADSVVPMRRKAGQPVPGVLDQPCLSIFGTAIPNHYYEALSRRMLTNGLFARMIVVEGGKRGVGQDAGPIDPPEEILATAKWWADYQPDPGNLRQEHPTPAIVPIDAEASAILSETRRLADTAYAAAEAQDDAVGTTVWGRTIEQSRKLALVYALSVNHRAPRIDAAAATWATRFVVHQTRRMLAMASGHVAENPFHAECLRLAEKLRAAPGLTLAHSVLLKRMKLDTQTFQRLVETMQQAGDIEAVVVRTSGRTGTNYRLLGWGRKGDEGEGKMVKEALGSAETGVKEGEGRERRVKEEMR
ncbi:MAG: bifunctional DNA primase/polymerase [Caulobacterales bacterium]|nr:bifunctional DNA primase/polymerase [Caulobacterales bacterium]